jgi:hypothetical protein
MELPLSSSTRLRGISSILFWCHTQDTFESLAKRGVRVIADRVCYLEQLPIVFLHPQLLFPPRTLFVAAGYKQGD